MESNKPFLDFSKLITRKETPTTDLSKIIGADAQWILSRLVTPREFGNRYNLKARGVLRHIIKGDLPAIWIGGELFVLDAGHQELIALPQNRLNSKQAELATQQLIALMAKVDHWNMRMQRPGHRREVASEFIKDKTQSASSYLKMGLDL